MGRCLPLAAIGPAGRRSIHGWLWCRRSRSGYSRTPAKTGRGRRKERDLKDYATNEGRPALYGTILEQVSEESSPFLANLGLAVRDTEPFFVGVERFTTLIFFSQLKGNSPVYRYHLFSLTCHSNIADLLCFLAYATTNMVGSNRHGFEEIMVLGSKTLGIKCIRTSICNVLANHDQNLEPRFRLLKVCLFVKLELSELQDLLAKFAKLDRLNLMQIYFLQIFSNSAQAQFDV